MHVYYEYSQEKFYLSHTHKIIIWIVISRKDDYIQKNRTKTKAFTTPNLLTQLQGIRRWPYLGLRSFSSLFLGWVDEAKPDSLWSPRPVIIIITANRYWARAMCQTFSEGFFTYCQLTLTTALWSRYYYCPCFTDEETKQQRNLPELTQLVRDGAGFRLHGVWHAVMQGPMLHCLSEINRQYWNLGN